MNSNVMEELEPAEVFRYFRELSKIPRGSGNEKAISDFLVEFAKNQRLEVIQDKADNVIIKRHGSRGYENSPAVVLQGHMDMVCEKTPACVHDFQKDPLQLRVADKEWLYATDTTLGADDGIAVAMGMAIVSSDKIKCPPIEFLVTTSEETGMDGAAALNPSDITGKTLINVDSEQEGILTVSCAGGCTAQLTLPLLWEDAPENSAAYRIDIGGLLGGHSGIEIDKGHANANKLLGRLLYHAGDRIRICSVEGGSKHNAIPRDAHAIVLSEEADRDSLIELVKNLEKTFRDEYKTADPGLYVKICPAEKRPEKMMEHKCAENAVRLLYLIPDGVQSMSMDIPGLVESSLNLGILKTEKEAVRITSTIRSCVGSLKKEIYSRIEAIAVLTNAIVKEEGQYPEWQYKPDSRLREICVEQYEKLFGERPVVTAIHAGLECALFAEKFGGSLDMISVGPTIIGVHTAQEHLNIPSVRRTWNYLLAILEALK